jgi:peptidoglycan/xylan/chitin deacetylase (PgdA/CDA1 family)
VAFYCGADKAATSTLDIRLIGSRTMAPVFEFLRRGRGNPWVPSIDIHRNRRHRSMGLLRYAVLGLFGFNALFRFLNRNSILIIMYHGICDDEFSLLEGYDDRQLPRSAFHKQLRYLKRKGYRFINMSELAEALSSGESLRKAVVLTFDDGFRNIITHAYPLLQELKAKGCYYLVSDLIGTEQIQWTDYVETAVRNASPGVFEFQLEGKTQSYRLDTKASYETTMTDVKLCLRQLGDAERREHLEQFGDVEDIPEEFLLASWEQIRDMDRNVLEVGCHTRTHPNCVKLSDEELVDEVDGSKGRIEEQVGYPVLHFCYPAGTYDDRVVKRVEDAGCVSAVTVDLGLNEPNESAEEPFRLKRVYATRDFAWFKAVTSGSYFLGQRVMAPVRRLLGAGQ